MESGLYETVRFVPDAPLWQFRKSCTSSRTKRKVPPTYSHPNGAKAAPLGTPDSRADENARSLNGRRDDGLGELTVITKLL